MMYAPTGNDEKEVYRDTRARPHWYCVKMVMHLDGKVESEIVVDENTKLPIVVQGDEKPQDATFETTTAITYYIYCQGYTEAARQVAAVRK